MSVPSSWFAPVWAGAKKRESGVTWLLVDPREETPCLSDHTEFTETQDLSTTQHLDVEVPLHTAASHERMKTVGESSRPRPLRDSIVICFTDYRTSHRTSLIAEHPVVHKTSNRIVVHLTPSQHHVVPAATCVSHRGSVLVRGATAASRGSAIII
jgi:hypothetical protein